MSKYYKAEDVTELINACEWRMTLAKERHGEGFVDYSKQILDVDELTKRLSSLPTIEVSEDCISREYLKSFEYINKGDFNSVETIREWIDNAPSVLPSRAEGEWIDDPKNDEIKYCSNCELGYTKDFLLGMLPYYNPNPQIVEPPYCPNCGAKMK